MDITSGLIKWSVIVRYGSDVLAPKIHPYIKSDLMLNLKKLDLTGPPSRPNSTFLRRGVNNRHFSYSSFHKMDETGEVNYNPAFDFSRRPMPGATRLPI